MTAFSAFADAEPSRAALSILKLSSLLSNDKSSIKIINFKIRNLINEDRNIKLVVYLKAVLGEDEYLTNRNLCVEKRDNILKIKNAFKENKQLSGVYNH